jgi:hypothetical protein
MVGAVNGVLGINFWDWGNGGNPQEFTDLSNLVAGQANQVLALTRRDPNIMNITGLTGLNEQIFTQNGSTLTAIYPDGNSTPFYVDGMPQAFALQASYNTSEIATYELVQHAVLVGSDPITAGALAAARVSGRRRRPRFCRHRRPRRNNGRRQLSVARMLYSRGVGAEMRDQLAAEGGVPYGKEKEREGK